MNPSFPKISVQEFLASFPPAIRRRGEQYYRSGAVEQMVTLEPGRCYGAVVQGSQKYQVSLEFDPDSETWMGECNCPMGFYCKHIYASGLSLPAMASTVPLSSAAGLLSRRNATAPAAKSPRPRPQKSKLPLTPLESALRQNLGQTPGPQPAVFIKKVQALFRDVQAGRPMTVDSLRQLTPHVYEYGWAHLELWPQTPKDDLECWLYFAWELRRRRLEIPDFMAPVTDFSRIEPAMKIMERKQEIERWRHQLAQPVALPLPKQTVDLQLMILPAEAQMQWKYVGEGNFKVLKPSHLRKLIQEYEANELAVAPEAVLFWSAIHQPFNYQAGFTWHYNDLSAGRIFARLLQVPELANRILDANAVPLARASEPLRYQLHPAGDETEDYRIELVTADGMPAPQILLIVAGQPSLYLTEHVLFSGPPPHALGIANGVSIPAPALESAAGAGLLQRLGLELPPRITKRIRRVSAEVKLSFQLRPSYPGSDSEVVAIKATAKVEGAPVEHCNAAGWLPLQGAAEEPKGKAMKKDGLIPLIDRAGQSAFPRLLESLGARWEPYQSAWSMRLTKKFPEVFLPWLESLPPGVEVDLRGDLATLRDAPLAGSVRLDMEEAGVDWFDLKVVLNISDTELTPEELRLLLNARGGYVRLGNKGWRRLQFNLTPEEDEGLARLGLSARDFSAEPQRLHALQLADTGARKWLPEQQVEKIHRRASELKARVTPPVPAGIQAELRPYQVEGFHFLSYLSANRFGGVLADDMGLGKTLQTLTWLAALRQGANSAAILPSLVVCPKSVMDNWRTETERFYPGLRVRLWRGENAAELPAARAENDLLVINYAQLRSVSPEMARHHWHAVILDEAQYIKNPDSQTAQVARALQGEHRLALTGTPIENRLLDLWSILAFAMPGALGNRNQFLRNYNLQDDPLARKRLAARVRPFLLRRTKGQVAKDLPDRIEDDLACEMENEQKTLYRAEFKRAQQMLLRVTTQKQLNEQRFNFLASLLRLRQICCHPALVDKDLRQSESAKVNALVELLEPLMEEGHKVLIFSQFVTMLNILQETLEPRGWPQFYLAGETENRGELVAKFQKAAGAAIFLISLKAGGFGLNLTAASYVVLFDPWWNPAVEMQAIDRTHRIGQTSKVIAYRLLMKDSIEQKIRQLQKTKAALAEDVLGEEKFAQGLTLADLRFLFSEQ